MFRRASANDADRIARLHSLSWQNAYRGILDDEYLFDKVPAERMQLWVERLSCEIGNQVVIICERSETLMGFVCLYLNHDPEYGALVDNLHVAPELHRQGIGKGLMEHATIALRESSEETGMYLWVLQQNSRAIRFYEKLGGVLTEERPYHGLGDHPVPACRIVWSIDGLSQIAG